MVFVKVVEDQNSSEVIELPAEDDNSLLLTTLAAQFPDAIGLRYKVPETGSIRGVRVTEGKLIPPINGSWADYTYVCTYHKATKRKADESERIENISLPDDVTEKKTKKTVDLIILDLSFKSDTSEVKGYFSQFGEVLLCEIKRDEKGKSKGYGFLRFKDYESQVAAMSKKHFIGGRMCEVKIPNNKFQGEDVSNRLFVGRVPEWMKEEHMHKYFSQFGEIANIFLPKNPFRGFAFLTFVDPAVALSLQKEDHIINGHSVFVHSANPKDQKKSAQARLLGHGGRQGSASNQQSPDTAAQIAAAVAAALAQAGISNNPQSSGPFFGYGDYQESGYQLPFQQGGGGASHKGGYGWDGWK